MRRIFFIVLVVILNFAVGFASAGVTWEPTKRLTSDSQTTTIGKGRTVATDSRNRVHVVWTRGQQLYYKRSLDGGQTWGSDILLTSNDAEEPSLTTDSQNRVHVVFEDRSDGNQGINYKRSLDGGQTWGNDIRLASGEVEYPSLATDSQNSVHVAWQFWPDEKTIEIHYKRSLDGGQNWDTDTRLTANGSGFANPSIAADSRERVHVVWGGGRPNNYQIYYKRSINGGDSWGSDVSLTNSGAANSPSIAADSRGVVHVVWEDWREGNSSEIYYKRSLNGGGSWGRDIRLTMMNGYSWDPSVATDFQGRVHVVWEEATFGEDDAIYYKRSVSGGQNWETNTLLANDGDGNLWLPSIATDSQNRLHVVWEHDRYNIENYQIYYKRGTQDCNHSSTRPVALSPSTPGPEITPLENFDVRSPSTVTAIVKPPDSRIQAVERFKAQFGDMVMVSWNPYNGTPNSLYNLKDGYLSGPISEPPETAALEFLKEHRDLFGLSEQELAVFETASYETEHLKTTHVSLSQTYHGIPIFGAQIKINVGKDGRIQSVGGAYYPGIDIPIVPTLPPAEALVIAAHDVAPGVNFEPRIISADPSSTQTTVFDKGPFNRTDGFHAAGLTIFPMRAEFHLAWQVILHKNSLERYLILVDANTAELLYRTNLVQFQSQGLIFEEDPDDAPQVLKSFDGDPFASPYGWLYQNGGVYSSLGGNNTCTQEDRDDDDAQGYSPSALDGHYEYSFQNAYENSGGVDVNTDLDAALANLFYQVNLVHDYFYSLGFDEAAGNFQTNNFGKGGLGEDEVHADGQDSWISGERNNANFYTPPDGNNPIYGKPRMQMYMSAPPQRYIDGDFSGDTIVHEYSHGLSNRLVGGPNDVGGLQGIQSGAMGEGWGDWFAGSIYNDPVYGEYKNGDLGKGLRRYALNNNPLTYADLCNGPYGCEVHFDGEIWSATLWDLRDKFIVRYGFSDGKARVEQLVVDGMRKSGSDPSMLRMRDAILDADSANGGPNQDIIWQAFACRGMGFSASTIDHNDPNPIEAFDLPGGASCSDTADLSVAMTDAPDPVKINDPLTYTATVTNNGPDDAQDVTLTDVLPATVTFVSALPSQGACTGTTTITCDLGEIRQSNSATVDIIVKPTVSGNIDNSASVTASTFDPDQANNVATVMTTVEERSCLGTGSFRLGGWVRDAVGEGILGVEMTLNGPDNCTDSRITVPSGYAFVGLAEGVYTVTPAKAGCGFDPANQTVTVNKFNNAASFRGTCIE